MTSTLSSNYARLNTNNGGANIQQKTYQPAKGGKGSKALGSNKENADIRITVDKTRQFGKPITKDTKKTRASRVKKQPSKRLKTRKQESKSSLHAAKVQQEVEAQLAAIEIMDITPKAEENAMIIEELDINNQSLEDIDAFDVNDPLFVTTYVDEIFDYMKGKELYDQPDALYMEKQTDLLPCYRGILIDWLAEVYLKFRLLSETMFLCVYIIDKFLSLKPVAKTKLQLVGTSALFIASKYEETYSPTVSDFQYLCDNAYSEADILKMERVILCALDFKLAVSSPLHFLRRYSKASRSDSKTHTLSKYLSELSCMSLEMLQFSPSMVAAASVYLARRMIGTYPKQWNSNLRHYTELSEENVLPCAVVLNNVLIKDQSSQKRCPFSRKYASSRLFAVAKIKAVPL